MISTSRKDVRQHFAGLLSTALSGTAQAVYAYRKGDFAGSTPVVTVSSLGSIRNPLTFQGMIPSFRLQVDVFVLYNDPASGWTEQNAEDKLDDIEEAITAVVAANQVVSSKWEGIDFAGWSDRVDISIGGVEYIREYLTLEFA